MDRLPIQLQVIVSWAQARSRVLAEELADDRGEVTGTTIMAIGIALAALAAVGIIAARIAQEAGKL